MMKNQTRSIEMGEQGVPEYNGGARRPRIQWGSKVRNEGKASPWRLQELELAEVAQDVGCASNGLAIALRQTGA